MKSWITKGMVLAACFLLTTTVNAKTLRMADSTDISSLDPHSITESNTIGFLHHIYEPLVRYNDNLKTEPALASSWEIISPTKWRFHLREGVTFHNGNSFTADDVVASIRRAIDPTSPVKSNLPAVKEIEKVDEYTVDMILKGTDPILLNYLTNIFILDKEWMEEHDALAPADIHKGKENYAVSNANGTGPFMVESRIPDSKTTLVVNSKWWDTPQHNLTSIEFTPISSDATRIAALLSGELDFVTPAPLQDVERINRAEGISVVTGPELRTIMLAFNMGEKLHLSNIKDTNPLLDVRVRKALSMGINLELIKKKVMRGHSRNAGLLVAPSVPGYDAQYDTPTKYDPAAAKALLAEAGYPDGFEIGFYSPNDRYVNDEELALAITSMWAKIGVKAHLNSQTKSKHFDKVFTGTCDIYMYGWATLPMLDSYSVLSALLHTPGGVYGAWNPGGYSNPKIDELTEKVAVELDQAKRNSMMTEALVIAKDDMAILPLHQQPLAWATSDKVKIKVTPDNKPRLWYVTMTD